MKKLVLTIAIVLGLSAVSFADVQKEGGLFKRGDMPNSQNGVYRITEQNQPLIPGYGESGDFDAQSPIGSGIALLLGLGGAYFVAKRRKEEK